MSGGTGAEARTKPRADMTIVRRSGRRLGVLAATGVALAITPSASAGDSPAPPHAERDLPTEYFALGLGGSPNGAATYATMITVRWRSLYWNVFEQHVVLGSPLISASAGTGFGYPLMSSTGSDELRLGAVAAGVIVKDEDDDGGERRFQGFGIVPSVSWVHHWYRHLAIDINLFAIVPVVGAGERDPDPFRWGGTVSIRI